VRGASSDRLDDNGVAGEQSRERHIDRQREGEVERGENAEDSVRLEDVAVGLALLQADQRLAPASALVDHVPVGRDQIDPLLNLGDRFGPRLAGLEAEPCCDLDVALADRIGDLAQRARAFTER
jgi:hypothetical protein